MHTHRALGHPSRAALLDVLAAEGGAEVDDLARRLDLHANTVRGHLDVLVRSGLVTTTARRTGTRGRPRLVYEAVPHAASGDDYRVLAEAFVRHLRSVPDPQRAAEDAGRDLGRTLLDRVPPASPAGSAREPGHPATPAPGPAGEPAVAAVRRLLAGLGFAPQLTDDGTLRLRRCPFLDLALDEPTVVCGLHLGVLRGVLDRLGVDPQYVDLTPFAEPGVCLATVSPPAAAS